MLSSIVILALCLVGNNVDNEPSRARYSPDKNITGLAFCDEHQELMALGFYLLLKNEKKKFDELMASV